MTEANQDVTNADVKGATRTGTQTGAFSALLGALLALNVVHLTPGQIVAIMPIGSGIACFVIRVVENRFGHALFRTVVEDKPVRRRRRKKKVVKP